MPSPDPDPELMHYLVHYSPVIDNQGDCTVDNGESDGLFMREHVRDKTFFRLSVRSGFLARSEAERGAREGNVWAGVIFGVVP